MSKDMGKIRPGFFCEVCNAPLSLSQTVPSKIAAGHGRFCSKKCQGVWWSGTRRGSNHHNWKGGEVEVTCKICDRVFSAKPSAIKRGLAVFCSRKCMGKARSGESSLTWQGGGVERKCETCGVDFLAERNQVERGWGRFCSTKCMGEWRSRALRGENSPAWRGGKEQRDCLICGQSFSARRNGNKRFCSLACHNKGQSGKGGPAWMGGKSFEPYPPTFNNAFKRKIRERDGYTCAICGAPDSKDVHHINYVKDDTVPENCITLCSSCHGKTNANRDRWQSVLTKLMQDRGYVECKASFLGVEVHWVEEA